MSKVDHWIDEMGRGVTASPAARKRNGVHYTPPAVVNYLVERTLGPLLAGQSLARGVRLRVLDPACGAGAFLLGAYDYLLRWYADRWQRPLDFKERRRILVEHIYGVDIDPNAVNAARGWLRRRMTAEEIADCRLQIADGGNADFLKRNLRCGDTLRDRPAPGVTGRPGAFHYTAAFSEVFAGEAPGFDVVTGNPPYVSYSGRQAAPLEPALRRFYGKRYAARGWLCAHGLFILRGIELTRDRLAFIVPGQVGHLAGYQPLRDRLTEQCEVTDVRYWGEDVFPGVVGPAMTFIAQKETRSVSKRRRARSVSEGGRLASVSDGIWRATVQTDRRTPSQAERLLQKIVAQGESLGQSVADPGVHTGNCAKKLIADRPGAEGEWVPVLEGKQIGRYTCVPPCKLVRLDYEANKARGEYFTIRPRKKYEEAAFVIRQTAAYPMVGPRRGATYFRNSLLALYPRPNLPERDIYFVVALLNSRLMRWVYQRLVPESGQKAFPQVKVKSLRALPIKRRDMASRREQTLMQEVARLAERSVQGGEDNDSAIEDRVAQLFAIGPRESLRGSPA